MGGSKPASVQHRLSLWVDDHDGKTENMYCVGIALGVLLAVVIKYIVLALRQCVDWGMTARQHDQRKRASQSKQTVDEFCSIVKIDKKKCNHLRFLVLQKYTSLGLLYASRM